VTGWAKIHRDKDPESFTRSLDNQFDSPIHHDRRVICLPQDSEPDALR
jgi:hypothetical protein